MTVDLDKIAIGDRVRLVTGKHAGKEGEVVSLSEVRAGRRVIFLKQDNGDRILAVPHEVEKIPRLIH